LIESLLGLKEDCLSRQTRGGLIQTDGSKFLQYHHCFLQTLTLPCLSAVFAFIAVSEGLFSAGASVFAVSAAGAFIPSQP
jgi:hypothetical protein